MSTDRFFYLLVRIFSDGMTEFNISTNRTSITESNNIFLSIRIILLALIMFSLSFITIFGNTIVIYALRTNRHLRKVI